MSQPKGNDKTARQTEASQADNQRNIEHDSGKLGASASQGTRAWDIENEACDSFSQKRAFYRYLDLKFGEKLGGILRQLIVVNDEQLADYRSKLAEYQSQIEKLEQKRHQLRELYEQLQGQASVGEEEE